VDLPGSDGGQRVLRSGADEAERGIQRHLGVPVSPGEHFLQSQGVGLTRVAAECVLDERPGALGLVLDQERVKRRERHRPGRRVGIPGATGGLLEHCGGRGWDVGAGAERDDQGGKETAHQIAFGEWGGGCPRHFFAWRVVGAGERRVTDFLSPGVLRFVVPLATDFDFAGLEGSVSTIGSGRSGGSRPIS